MAEQFIATVQDQGRIVIDYDIRKLLKIKTGDQVRLTIEKVKKDEK